MTVVRFSNTNGNYIAGGTSSGQIVLWDITGRLEALEKAHRFTEDQQRYRRIMVTLIIIEIYIFPIMKHNFNIILPNTIILSFVFML